jgi:predicted membrane-bound spermidine synthase
VADDRAEGGSTLRIGAAICLVAAGSLLLELTFVRVFSVLFFSHYSFLIISTALFGLGVAGVVLHLRGVPSEEGAERRMRRGAICFALAAVLAMTCAHVAPMRLSAAMKGQTKDLISLLVYYVVLGAPFYFVGEVLSTGLSVWSRRSSVLYFSDLLGAGAGCLLLFVTIGPLMPMGASLVVAALGLLSAALVARSGSWRFRVILAGTAVLCLAESFTVGDVVPLIPRERKRDFRNDFRQGDIEWTRWGVLSRVDVARAGKARKTIWIDGGINQSALLKFSGDYENDFDHDYWDGRQVTLVYQIRDPGRVIIIGPAGLKELVAAVGYRAAHVTGVEMDPLIVRLVTRDYAGYIGRPCERNDVTMVCAEGRGYIERTGETYDIIQQVNNFTPIAMASGALNVSETYLLTVEAFDLYFRRLSDRGIVDLVRHGGIRVASVAMEALRRLGVSEPWKHIVMLNEETLVKKTPWTAEELQRIRELAKQHARTLIFMPDEALRPGEWYDQFLRSPRPEEWYNRDVANLAPSTDDWPFFNHYVRWGRSKDPTLPQVFAWYNGMKIGGTIPHGDFVLLCVLAEAALLSLVFLVLPLAWRRRTASVTVTRRPVVYFSCLGAGFIFVEICLMQRLTLLLGHPSLSLAVVMPSLLIAAGLGSLCTRPLAARGLGALRAALLLIAAVLVVASFGLQALVRWAVQFGDAGRIALAIGITFAHGFLLGMPFPFALRLMSDDKKDLIPWCWAMNSYLTVIGTVMSVILAILFGFRTVYLCAAAMYVLALLVSGSLPAARNRNAAA